MRHYSLIIVPIVLFIFTHSVFSAQQLPLGVFKIDGKLDLECYTHRLGDGWSATKASNKGINYSYAYNASSPTAPSWSRVYGQTAFIDVAFNPTDDLYGEVSFEFINQYADRYWQPVNYEHKLDLDNQRFSWNKADITYQKDGYSLNYFRGVGHYHWGDKGDLFNLFSEQYETDRYLRIGGHPIPEGYWLSLSGENNSLDLVFGPEAIWNYKEGVFLNYSSKYKQFSNTVIYTDYIIPYGDPDERMRSLEFSTGFEFFKVGVLYQPFRLNRTYEYVEETTPGQGVYGTKYLKKTGTTNTSDAFGGSVKLLVPSPLFVDTMMFQGSYLGLAAGNKKELKAQFNRTFSRSLIGTFDYIYRKPLLGPIPLIYEGTVDNTGPALFEPRGPDSPFWVGWNYMWNNREASILSFTFTYDPTPMRWFYRYQPNILDEWNLNPKENAPFSCALNYTLTRYPSGTDRLVYFSDQGRMVWEPATSPGAWPVNDYISSFKLLCRSISRTAQILYDIGFGEDVGTSSFAYTPLTVKEKAITGYFSTGVTTEVKDYTFKARYSQDIWGPEMWHKDFGQTFDELYQAHISKKFGESLTAGLEYVGTREIDKKYFAPELGEYDEIRCFLTLYFGPVTLNFGTGEDEAFLLKRKQATVTKKLPEPAVPMKTPQPVIQNIPQDMKMEEQERGLVMTSLVLFDTGKSELKAGAGKILDTMVEILQQHGSQKVSVEGHTDNQGTAVYNQKLSEKRARSVAGYLMRAGIPSERLHIAGFGSDLPVASNETAKGREENRRVEVIILKNSQ